MASIRTNKLSGGRESFTLQWRESGEQRGLKYLNVLVDGVNIVLMEFTFFDQHTVLLSTVDTPTETEVLESTVLWGTVSSSNPLSSTSE